MAESEPSGLTPLQNAVYLLKQAQARLAAYEYAQAEPIAVVGMGCRFPGGADGPEAFWRILSSGMDAVCEVPPERWNIEDYYDRDPTAPGKMNTRWGGFLQKVDEFDAEFFGISPREASRVDPQQRLLLEVSWEALEDAGIVPAEIAHTNTGVYVGVIGSDYALMQARDIAAMDVFTGTGSSHAILANRISYILNINGPSIALDTACSSSLVTVHLACQSLRRREIDLALAGGVNLILGPEMTLTLTKAHMMSPDGRCHTFDAMANGYVRGEGCGVVVLKRLSDARAAGDRILALIRGSAVNHDGRSNGLSAPNGPAQEAVIRAALGEARLEPGQLSYIEAHGTGTRLGDPIEIEALRSVFGHGRPADQPLVVGSVKTNIGHLESAAGIAGLLKIILALRHGQIPPHLHLRTVNPLLRLEPSLDESGGVPIEIPTAIKPWPKGAEPRRAGVSSFGFGGTNGHVVLEEAPSESLRTPALFTKESDGASGPDRPWHLLTLSARSPQALRELAGRYTSFLQDRPCASFDPSDAPDSYASPAYTAATGRTHFAHRLAIPASSAQEAAAALAKFHADPAASDSCYGEAIGDQPPRIAFLFTGQGAQYAGMGLALYESQPVFRAALDRCGELLHGQLDRLGDRRDDRPSSLTSTAGEAADLSWWDDDNRLLSLLSRQAEPNLIGETAILDQTGYTQPVMFALEYSLAVLWRSWGIEPAAVLGHSVGEFAAACVAGVLSLEDAAYLIAERARLMQALPPGGRMAAVFAPQTRVAEAIEPYGDDIAIAALNGPESIVISGDAAAVDEVLTRLECEQVKSKLLATSHAFHSQRMDPMLDGLRQAAARVACSKPKVDIVANLTGELADEHTFADPCYWSRHARSPVQFARSMNVLADRGCTVFLEIGPSPTLIGLGQRCLADGDYAWLTSLRRGRDDWQSMLDCLGQLYVRGAKVDWAPVFLVQREGDRPYQRRRVSLPTYPFQRKRYWAGSPVSWSMNNGDPNSTIVSDPHISAHARNGREAHPLLGGRLVAAVSEQVFQNQLSAHRPATLADHKIQGKVIMPCAAYLEMALAASSTLHGRLWCVRDMSPVEPLLLGKKPVTVQTIVSPEGPQAASFRIVSLTAEGGENSAQFATHCVGRLTVPSDAKVEIVDLEAIRSRFTGEVRDIAWRTEALRKSGIEPGPTFSWLTLHWTNPTEALGQLRPPCETDRAGQYSIHPGFLDSVFQLLGLILPGAGAGIDAFVPMSLASLRCFSVPQGPLWALALMTSYDGTLAVGNVDLIDDRGSVVARMEGASLRRVSRDWIARLEAGPLPDWCYELAWDSQPYSATEVDESILEPDRWLIFDSRGGLGADLAERLRMKSHDCTVIPSGISAESRRNAVQQFLSGERPARQGIVYLSGLNVDGEGQYLSCQEAAPDFVAARRDSWGAALDLVHAVTASGNLKPPRLWLVTRGAQAAGDISRVALSQSPIWGLGRVIAAEYPELGCMRIDLDPTTRRDEADQLAEEILLNQREDQVAYRGGERFVARLRRLGHVDAAVSKVNRDWLQVPRGRNNEILAYRMEITSRGELDNVALRPASRQPPGPGQVEIKVHATGLNFRDVLNVLDLYHGDPGPLGGECSGEIVAVGPGVEQFRPGDAVFGLAPASFASYVTTVAQFVAPMPQHLTYEEAATIPICFLTVQHALRTLGELKPGERVLIHAASGGVGLAAIQIARLIGAEVFATAGSPRKREYLKSLGIQHVMDSRTLDFAQQILATTDGTGIDLVLNSRTGDSIAASLSLLREGGRFLELGKTDLWDQPRVDAFRPGVKFFAIALDRMMAEEPQAVGRLLATVLPLFADKTLQPLPIRTFPLPRVVDALRHMARTEHIGKIVVQATSESESAKTALVLREDATYLITGGLGGLGLKLAQWLVERGARHLVLVGRSAASEEARIQLDAVIRPGVEIAVRKCDIGNQAEVVAVLAEIEREMPPLRGVFHLAGTLDDAPLSSHGKGLREQTRERFDRVMAAKVHGAWNLHELTRETPLDMFVLFSSAAALLGSPGQGNYAAANAFLDALAHHRRGLKLPALSVNWGSWDEVGMAARLKETEGQRWAAAGIGWIGLDQGMATLERLIRGSGQGGEGGFVPSREDRVQAAVLPIDWAKFFGRIPADNEPAWLTEMARTARSAGPAAETGPPDLSEKLQAATPAERLELTVASLRQEAARVLAMDDAHLPDPRRTLNELGFDSLTAVEFCNRVSRAIGQRLNPTVLFDYPTLEALAGYLLRTAQNDKSAGLALEPVNESPAAESPDCASQDSANHPSLNKIETAAKVLDDVEGMSEADMDALVTAQLERLAARDESPFHPLPRAAE